MRIRKLLGVAVAITIGVVTTIVVTDFWITARLESVSQAQGRAQLAARETSDLLVLTHEYALYSEDRAAQQWQDKHKRIIRVLERNIDNDVPVSEDALTEAKRLDKNFQQLVAAKASNGELRSQQISLLLSQLLSGAQSLNDSIHLWVGEAEQRRQIAEYQFHVAAVISIMVLLLGLAIMAGLIYRRVLRPLSTLHRAVQAVARGDVSVRSATDAQDEFGELSRTFDAMAVDLVSNLQREIANRSEAEQSLSRANVDLHAREGLLRQILDTSSVAIFLVDDRGQIVQANQRMAQMFGVPLDKLNGMGYVELIHPAERQIAREKMLALLASEIDSVDLERRYWRDDKTEFWGHLTGKRFIDAQGVRRGLVGVIVDVTDRRQAETRLLNSKAIVDSTDDAVISKTLSGIITSWNPAAERMFGYSGEEAVGNSMLILIPDDRTQEEPLILERISRGDRIEHFETIRRHKDGRLIDISATISPIRDEAGKIVGASKIARDITAQKQAEAELSDYRNHLETLVEERTVALSVAKDVAEAANRAKSIFLANMSHELRTPMNAILGMTDLVKRKATDPKQIDQLTKVTTASKQLLAIINDILEISKIEADQLKLEAIEFQLGAVFENTSSLTRQRAQEKNVYLMMDIPGQLANQHFIGDPLRLGQVLINLVANAIKFTADGSVAVRAHLAYETSTDAVLRFEVQDTGIGISPEDQKRLFVAFEQADGSTTRKYGGTGLGLAICKRLVQAMKGDIGVISEVGVGSTFWFTVQLAKSDINGESLAEPVTRNAEAVLLAQHAGERVLLVEDEPINQEVSKELLESVGLIVDIAEDGLQAVELAGWNRYSTILMDLQMPKLNGSDATRLIRKQALNGETPILALTANAFDEDRLACLKAGMDDHIGKPIDPDVLFETLLKWMSKKRD